MANHNVTVSDITQLIRKIRKKLRQIENLETVTRALTDEEELKVSKKDRIRSLLQDKITELGDESLPESNISYTSQDSSLTNDPDTALTCPPEHPLQTDEESEQGIKMKRKVESVESNEPEEEHVESTVKVSRIQSGSLGEVSHLNGSTGLNESTEAPLSAPKEKPRTIQGKGDWQPEHSKDSSPTSWSSAKFIIHELESHNDIIVAVDCIGDTIISGSRDTMVKVWDMETKEELHSFGGHTDTVTSVKLLNNKENERLANVDENIPDGCKLALSSSLDCSIKLWCISSASLIRSMYTYNPVTCIEYFDGLGYIVSGSGGGKVELWDVESGDNLFSTLAHERVSCLLVEGNKLYSGSSEGIIKVWQLHDKSLSKLFSSENSYCATSSKPLCKKPVRCLALHNHRIYYGDEGPNIKVLTWKTGKVNKLRNHINDFGLTDAIHVTDNLLISTGLDVDTGNSFINVRVLPGEVYVATITEENLGRVIKIAVTKNKQDSLRIVTAGRELTVWDLIRKKQYRPQDAVAVEFISSFSAKAIDTDQESEFSTTNDECDDDQTQRRRSSSLISNEPQNTLWSWCSVL